MTTLRTSMRILIAGILLVVLPLTGCFVGSLQPLYQPSDGIFDKNLLGTWSTEDSRNTMIIARVPGAQQDRHYNLVYLSGDNASVYEARMVEIAKVRYLDVFPRDASRRSDVHFLPTHSIWKIVLDGDSLKVSAINEDWVKEQIEKKVPLFPAQRVADDVVLTASPTELQEFVRGYSEELFLNEAEEWRRR